MKVEYPQSPGQGKRKDQYEASAKCIIAITLICMAIAIGTYLWNAFILPQ